MTLTRHLPLLAILAFSNSAFAQPHPANRGTHPGGTTPHPGPQRLVPGGQRQMTPQQHCAHDATTNVE